MSKDCLSRGISEVFIDLFLTLIVLGTSGVLLTYLVPISQNYSSNIYNDMEDLESLSIQAILIKTENDYLLVIYNYGSSVLNCTVFIDNDVRNHLVLKPRGLKVLRVTPLQSISDVMILVNDDVIIKPQVINS